MFILKTISPHETERVGALLGALLVPGDVICLYGDLGAGKTCFARGVARGLGVEEVVTSPTFTLINEYKGRLPIYHMDSYRLEGINDVEDIGYEEYFYGEGVTLLEWPERIKEILPSERLNVYITPDEAEENCRNITLKGLGERYDYLVRELVKNVSTGD